MRPKANAALRRGSIFGFPAEYLADCQKPQPLTSYRMTGAMQAARRFGGAPR